MLRPYERIEDLSEFDDELDDEALDRGDRGILCICGDCNYGERTDTHGE